MTDETTKAILQELLSERKKDRRASYFKIILIAVLGLTYLWGMAKTFGVLGMPEQPKDYAALVKITGPIAADKPASYADLSGSLQKAFQDQNAKGVVLLINSPGGTPVQSSLIFDLVMELKKKHNKKVIAVGEDMMTSGAYFIAASADKIYANPSTVTGSIGVISAGFGFSEALAKLGVQRRVATAGDSKNLLDAFSPEDIEGKAKQTELLEAIHKHFIASVQAGRGDRLARGAGHNLFDGTVWTGVRAQELGLVDEIGSITNAAQREFGVETFVSYMKAKPLMEELIGNLGLTAGKAMGATLSSAVTGDNHSPMLVPR